MERGIVFGAWLRGYFLPSPGSWDMDYWKGDTAHLEISTAMDQAVLAEQKLTPSWLARIVQLT